MDAKTAEDELVRDLQIRVLEKQLENAEKQSRCMDMFMSVMGKVEDVLGNRTATFLNMLLNDEKYRIFRTITRTVL